MFLKDFYLSQLGKYMLKAVNSKYIIPKGISQTSLQNSKFILEKEITDSIDHTCSSNL
jgi:hypothetical protein